MIPNLASSPTTLHGGHLVSDLTVVCQAFLVRVRHYCSFMGTRDAIAKPLRDATFSTDCVGKDVDILGTRPLTH
ncbi:protein of unknown function [Burkholderia multivorans]